MTLHADWWLVVLGFPLVVVDGTREKGKAGDKVVFDKKPRILFLRGFSCLGPLVVGSEKQVVQPFLFWFSLGEFSTNILKDATPRRKNLIQSLIRL